jgi:hypothetical protein
VDPVSVIDLLTNTGIFFGTATVFGLLGIDEFHVAGWTFSAAEYTALVSNWIFGRNSYSQSIEYITNLRENWTLRDLMLYINNKSKTFDFILPVYPQSDICIAIPTAPPRLVLS